MTTIVIAEDEAIIRLDLRELLEEEGYVVVGEAGRGDQAVDLVRQLTPDLVILDVKMPGMDGIEAARRITAEGICAVLMLTAFSQREIVEQARDAGAVAYLVKPFQKTELVPAIELATARYAETNCPFIPEAALRISTTYDDPKEFDDTPIESEKYVERENQIAMECLYVFSKVI